jgi:hypothetical protein
MKKLTLCVIILGSFFAYAPPLAAVGEVRGDLVADAGGGGDDDGGGNDTSDEDFCGRFKVPVAPLA